MSAKVTKQNQSKAAEHTEKYRQCKARVEECDRYSASLTVMAVELEKQIEVEEAQAKADKAAYDQALRKAALEAATLPEFNSPAEERLRALRMRRAVLIGDPEAVAAEDVALNKLRRRAHDLDAQIGVREIPQLRRPLTPEESRVTTVQLKEERAAVERGIEEKRAARDNAKGEISRAKRAGESARAEANTAEAAKLEAEIEDEKAEVDAAVNAHVLEHVRRVEDLELRLRRVRGGYVKPTFFLNAPGKGIPIVE